MKRFSLNTLLILITAVAVFLGYSQWRRQQIIAACESLETEGVYISLPNERRDRIWQRPPTDGEVIRFVMGAEMNELEAKARAVGVEQLHYRPMEVR